MKRRFGMTVERGRVREGPWGSESGNTCGLFVLRHPTTSRRFKAIVGDGMGWDHVSVSSTRTPTWDEMAWVKRLFFEDDECVVQYHPPDAVYVNEHKHCLHMWRWQDGEFPMPPIECV